jgi:hypothetical protein
MKVPVYNNRPIGSIEALAKALSKSPAELIQLSSDADRYYRPNKPEIKPNGGVRQTYSVSPYLQGVHKRIIEQIFYHVDYPLYLQGGIKDTHSPRDYIANASLHAGRRVVISEDISKFFPSIRDPLVLKMWQHFFHFPKYVAQLLTQLTIYKGFVPQGAATSSYIANLVFWDREPQLEHTLRQRGFYYSRFVDDITVSTDREVEKKELQAVTSMIYGMFISAGVKPNRDKRAVQTRGGRMRVHNLNVDSGRPTMNRKERSRIRAAVKRCEIMALPEPHGDKYKKLYDSVRGRVAVMARLHPKEAGSYIRRLDAIKPR